MKIKHVLSRMSHEDHAKLEEMAKRESRSISTMVIQLVRRSYEEFKKEESK